MIYSCVALSFVVVDVTEPDARRVTAQCGNHFSIRTRLSYTSPCSEPKAVLFCCMSNRFLRYASDRGNQKLVPAWDATGCFAAAGLEIGVLRSAALQGIAALQLVAACDAVTSWGNAMCCDAAVREAAALLDVAGFCVAARTITMRIPKLLCIFMVTEEMLRGLRQALRDGRL